MESLRLSFEAITPIFLMMLLGYTLKRLKFADKKCFDSINKFVFKIFLPTLLFYNVYKTETAGIFDMKLIGFTVAGVLCIFVLGFIAVMMLSSDNSKRGVMLQGFFRSNFAILGVPVVGYICGDNATGLTSLMVAVVIPLFNILAIIALESFRRTGERVSVLHVLKGIVRNPLIIGCALGFVFFVFGIKLPSVVEKPIKDVASAATPLAIIVLGAGFEFSSIRGYAREIAIVVSARLVIVPLLVLPFAILFGFSGEALACLLITFASPIAVSSFAMAQQMDGDEKLTAQIIVISSALCLVTLFLWIFVLGIMGLF